MNRGFSLIELLGVILIIAVIATIAVIAVDNSIKKGKITTCKAQEENIIEAAKTWQIDKGDYDTTQIKIKSDLIDDGYLESDLKNPMTDEVYTNNDYVEVTITTSEGKNGYSYKVKYDPESNGCIN